MAVNGGKSGVKKDELPNDMADLVVPAALRAWLIFLLLFTLMGYPVGFSILFGAAGGFAWGTVSAWWDIKGGAPLPNEAEREAQGIARLGFRLPEWQLRRDRRRIYNRRSR